MVEVLKQVSFPNSLDEYINMSVLLFKENFTVLIFFYKKLLTK